MKRSEIVDRAKALIMNDLFMGLCRYANLGVAPEEELVISDICRSLASLKRWHSGEPNLDDLERCGQLVTIWRDALRAEDKEGRA